MNKLEKLKSEQNELSQFISTDINNQSSLQKNKIILKTNKYMIKSIIFEKKYNSSSKVVWFVTRFKNIKINQTESNNTDLLYRSWKKHFKF